MNSSKEERRKRKKKRRRREEGFKLRPSLLVHTVLNCRQEFLFDYRSLVLHASHFVTCA